METINGHMDDMNVHGVQNQYGRLELLQHLINSSDFLRDKVLVMN